MSKLAVSRLCVALMLLFGLTGCFGSSVKPELSICEQLEENDEWAEPLVRAQEKYGTPLSLTLVLLEPPLSDLDKRHIQPRTADWDEYRIRSENWGAVQTSPLDAVDFIGWFTRESLKRNQTNWNDVSAHYLSYRMGHGAYHRFDAKKYPELVIKAQDVAYQAKQWRSQLKNCRLQLQQQSWYNRLKFW